MSVCGCARERFNVMIVAGIVCVYVCVCANVWMGFDMRAYFALVTLQLCLGIEPGARRAPGVSAPLPCACTPPKTYANEDRIAQVQHTNQC